MTKDYLLRPLEIGDFVVYMRQSYREMNLARIYAFTASGKVRIRWGDSDYQTLLQEGRQLVKVEGPDLTMFLLKQK
jgi:hypothetical protein